MNKKWSFLLIILLCIMYSCQDKEKADAIYTHGVVYTVDDSMEVVEAFAIRNGRFLAVGSNKEIVSNYEADTIIDLKGRPVYPGFIDPHCHFWGYGTVLQQADLTGIKTREELYKRLKEYSSQHPDLKWITGRGWDNTMWENTQMPDNSRLNRLFPETPVVLRRVDGHAILANQKAIVLAGAENMDGKAGPAGIFLDKDAGKILKAVPELNEQQKKQALLDAQDDCFAVGLTSVHDAGMDWHWVKRIQELHQQGQLKMRIYAMLNPTHENLKKMYEGPVKTDYLNVRSLKLYADGALGSRGAKLIEPYSDKPETNGLLLINPDTMLEYCQLAYDLGFQVNTHAIGDSANRLVLDVYAKVLRETNDFRWRIEHSQVVHPDDLEKFGHFSIIPSIQTTHATSDMDWAGERLGVERLKHAYQYKKLLKQNGWLPNGSDFPVEDINPLYGFYAAISRKDKDGNPENGFMDDQALSRKEALKAMTIWAAKAGFEESEKGSIQKGKMADFVILEKDIMKIPVKETFSVNVIETYLNGEKVMKR
ncbi:MAG: amidohydrolase [Bacteroidales bacterium]|nr:amidohydrolase [Bacteroidales bacterium]